MQWTGKLHVNCAYTNHMPQIQSQKPQINRLSKRYSQKHVVNHNGLCRFLLFGVFLCFFFSVQCNTYFAIFRFDFLCHKSELEI